MKPEKVQIVLVGERNFSDEELEVFQNKLIEKWPEDVPKPIIITGFHTAFKV